VTAGVAIRRLVAGDALLYWQLRNRGLMEFPDAFTTSYEEGVATPPEKLAKRFGDRDNGNDDFVLGAFEQDRTLVGFIGFERETRCKVRHNALVLGMYVAPAMRGQGVGKKLLATLIEECQELDGLELIRLTVTETNRAACTLYARAGFVTFGVEARALKLGDKYFTKVHMQLQLG
jgi:L-amino acid N-acyltransferase YncA